MKDTIIDIIIRGFLMIFATAWLCFGLLATICMSESFGFAGGVPTFIISILIGWKLVDVAIGPELKI